MLISFIHMQTLTQHTQHTNIQIYIERNTWMRQGEHFVENV